VPDAVLGEAPCAVYVPRDGVSPSSLAAAARAGALREDEVPRWYLPRPELPRGPSGKLRRGLLALEAARWTSAFTTAVVPEHRALPAFDLPDGLTVVDGWPTAKEPGPGRVLAIVKRSPLALVGLAYVAAIGSTRYILPPPDTDALDTLLRLASLLPGDPPSVICARATDLPGFEPTTVAGWSVQRTPDASDAAVAGAIAGIGDLPGPLLVLNSGSGSRFPISPQK
jgi:hypothetical protein